MTIPSDSGFGELIWMFLAWLPRMDAARRDHLEDSYSRVWCLVWVGWISWGCSDLSLFTQPCHVAGVGF